MKTLKIKFLLLLLFIIPIGALQGQDDSSQAYWVHEDRVKPSMVMEYEQAAKDLVAQSKKHQINGSMWITTSTMDFRYLYVSPINSLADINYDGFGTLQEKMGEEAFNKLFSDMDKCYDTHGDYVLILDKELSYMPSGLTQTPEGQDYRKFYYLHTTPGKVGKLKEKMAAVKKLYQDKGSKSEYRVYRSGFGTMGSYYMVAIAAEDAVSFESGGVENDKLLGDEAPKVFGEVMKYISKMEEISGRMRPDLAYIPEN